MADPRIPIGEPISDPAAYLVEGDAPAPAHAYVVRFTLPRTDHATGCACCAPRGPAAVALATMFRARATGAAPFFSRVTLRGGEAGRAAVQSAIAEDALTAARFRLDEDVDKRAV